MIRIDCVLISFDADHKAENGSQYFPYFYLVIHHGHLGCFCGLLINGKFPFLASRDWYTGTYTFQHISFFFLSFFLSFFLNSFFLSYTLSMYLHQYIYFSSSFCSFFVTFKYISPQFLLHLFPCSTSIFSPFLVFFPFFFSFLFPSNSPFLFCLFSSPTLIIPAVVPK